MFSIIIRVNILLNEEFIRLIAGYPVNQWIRTYGASIHGVACTKVRVALTLGVNPLTSVTVLRDRRPLREENHIGAEMHKNLNRS
jgi:hypothetical protein